MAAIPPITGLGGLSPISPTGPVDAAGGAFAPSAPGRTPGATGLDSLSPGSGASGQSGSFVDVIGDAFSQLNSQLTTADASMANFAAGGSADLHTVMLQMQEASLGLKVGLQVRDRLLEAYQELMRMQI